VRGAGARGEAARPACVGLFRSWNAFLLLINSRMHSLSSFTALKGVEPPRVARRAARVRARPRAPPTPRRRPRRTGTCAALVWYYLQGIITLGFSIRLMTDIFEGLRRESVGAAVGGVGERGEGRRVRGKEGQQPAELARCARRRSGRCEVLVDGCDRLPRAGVSVVSGGLCRAGGGLRAPRGRCSKGWWRKDTFIDNDRRYKEMGRAGSNASSRSTPKRCCFFQRWGAGRSQTCSLTDALSSVT